MELYQDLPDTLHLTARLRRDRGFCRLREALKELGYLLEDVFLHTFAGKGILQDRSGRVYPFELNREGLSLGPPLSPAEVDVNPILRDFTFVLSRPESLQALQRSIEEYALD